MVTGGERLGGVAVFLPLVRRWLWRFVCMPFLALLSFFIIPPAFPASVFNAKSIGLRPAEHSKLKTVRVE